MQQTFNITGMVCAGCQHNIQKTINKMKGVRKASVNLISNTMDVIYDDKITADDIIAKVASIGYGANLRPVDNSVSNR